MANEAVMKAASPTASKERMTKHKTTNGTPGGHRFNKLNWKNKVLLNVTIALFSFTQIGLPLRQ